MFNPVCYVAHNKNCMNMNGIQIFRRDEFGNVRILMTENSEPLFCLADVCKVLDLDASQVMRRLEDGVVTIHPIVDSLGREQQANVPYQKYVDCNYFRVIEQKYMRHGEPCIGIKTLVYQRGVDYVRKLLKAKKRCLATLGATE